jgi:hypothetical protein
VAARLLAGPGSSSTIETGREARARRAGPAGRRGLQRRRRRPDRRSGCLRDPDRPGAPTFVIKPRGWQTPVDAANLPRFYAMPGTGPAADFALVRSDEPDDIRALILTDPQPASAAEVGYLSRGLVERIGRRTDVAFGVTLGDIVYDRPDLFGAVNAVLARVGNPLVQLAREPRPSARDPDEARPWRPSSPSTGRRRTRSTRARALCGPGRRAAAGRAPLHRGPAQRPV